MLNKLLRQRRRVAFAFLMVQLAMLRIAPDINTMVTGTAVIMVVVLLLVASGPRARRSVECAAVALFVSTAVPGMIGFPSVAGTALIFIVATMLIYAVAYGPLLDHLPVRIGLRSRKTFTAPYDHRTTWSKTVPGQGHPAAYWTGTMMSCRTDEFDDDTLYLTFREEGAPIEEVTVTYLTILPMHDVSYLLERDTQHVGEEVIMGYSFAHTGDETTTLFSDMQVSGLPIRMALERFFDDVLGDELDHFATMTACKRTWSFRDKQASELTSELGEGTVTLNLDPELSAPVADTAPVQKLSA